MRSRALNKRIDIYETTPTSDGFGGSTSSVALKATVWASLETLKASRNYLDLGLDFTRLNIKVTTRERSDFDYNSSGMYFKYRGKQYTIKSYPINANFEDAFISFIGVLQK